MMNYNQLLQYVQILEIHDQILTVTLAKVDHIIYQGKSLQ